MGDAQKLRLTEDAIPIILGGTHKRRTAIAPQKSIAHTSTPYMWWHASGV